MSFNSLLGFGSHSKPSRNHGLYLMNDNAASATVVDYSGNSNHGTLVNADTDDQSVASGVSWLPSALRLDASPNKYISLPFSDLGSNSATLIAFLKVASDPPGAAGDSGFGVFGEYRGTVSGASHHPFTDSNVYNSTWRGSNSTTVSRVTVGNPTPSLASWRVLCIKSEPGANGWKFKLDGSVISQTTGHASLYTAGVFQIGWSERTAPATPTNYYLRADLGLYLIADEAYSDGDEAEVAAGPEPICVVAPSLTTDLGDVEGATFGGDNGTWALPTEFAGGSNGTITYTYRWTRSTDDTGTGETNISSATSGTYTATSDDIGYYLRRFVRGTNDGGYDDAADTPTEFSGEITADDGITADASITIAAITVSSAATSDIAANSNLTLQGITASGTATSSIEASGSVTLAAIQASGTASSSIVADASITLGAITASGEASPADGLDAEITLDPITVTATATSAISAVGSIVLQAITASGTATSGIIANADIAIAAISVSGTMSGESQRTSSLFKSRIFKSRIIGK